MSHNKTTSTGLEAESVGKLSKYKVLTSNTTLTVADSGTIFGIGTDALVISLPATIEGAEFTFVNIGAAGNNIITIDPVTADGIAGTITLAATVVARPGTANTNLVNTKATALPGDSVKLIGTGVSGTNAWIIASSTGIWA